MQSFGSLVDSLDSLLHRTAIGGNEQEKQTAKGWEKTAQECYDLVLLPTGSEMRKENDRPRTTTIEKQERTPNDFANKGMSPYRREQYDALEEAKPDPTINYAMDPRNLKHGTLNWREQHVPPRMSEAMAVLPRRLLSIPLIGQAETSELPWTLHRLEQTGQRQQLQQRYYDMSDRELAVLFKKWLFETRRGCVHEWLSEDSLQGQPRQQIGKCLNSHVKGKHAELNKIRPPGKSLHLRILVEIEGRATTLALVDSGATRNYLSKSFVDLYDFPTRNKKARSYALTVANGKE
ncbi:MAG: hypothetical protein M1823_006466, partial [Watsoniomyces obsoletus]